LQKGRCQTLYCNVLKGGTRKKRKNHASQRQRSQSRGVRSGRWLKEKKLSSKKRAKIRANVKRDTSKKKILKS